MQRIKKINASHANSINKFINTKQELLNCNAKIYFVPHNHCHVIQPYRTPTKHNTKQHSNIYPRTYFIRFITLQPPLPLIQLSLSGLLGLILKGIN